MMILRRINKGGYMGSGNYLVDMWESEQDRRLPDDYCTDCKSAPCRCDELVDQRRDGDFYV